MLRIILVIAMIAVSLLLMGCSDDVVNEVSDTQGVSVSEDALGSDASGLDAEGSPADAGEASTDVDEQDSAASEGGDSVPAEPIGDDAEELPSDPTENPGDQSAHYSFPAWEIPPSNDDNR